MPQEGVKTDRWKLGVLFCLHAAALGMYGISLSSVLRAHGFESIVPFVFATTSLAALISPLAIGGLADQRFSSERVLRWLGTGSMICLAILFWGIHKRWPAWSIVVLAQVHALWSAPTFGMTTSLVMSRLTDAKQQFGQLRLWATIGWMGAGFIVSLVLKADTSPLSGWAGCVMWALTVLFTFTLAPVPPPARVEHRTWKQILGLDALHLLRHHDHRIVFITAALINIPLAAFYPFTVLHLEDLHIAHPTAVMSLGQLTEILGMVVLSSLLSRYRLKWVFLSGIAFGVARYALFTHGSPWAMYLGIFLHGACFTLFIVTAQIYLEQRIPPEMRARAQALLTLMMSGIGSLVGTLGCGWWRVMCKDGGTAVDWSRFWLGLTVVMMGVMLFFAIAYRGRKHGTLAATAVASP